jgi:hypothetical protein
MRDEPDRRWHQRAQAVVHRLEIKALQVGNIARDVEGENLASAVVQEFVAADKAVRPETVFRPLPLS